MILDYWFIFVIINYLLLLIPLTTNNTQAQSATHNEVLERVHEQSERQASLLEDRWSFGHWIQGACHQTVVFITIINKGKQLYKKTIMLFNHKTNSWSAWRQNYEDTNKQAHLAIMTNKQCNKTMTQTHKKTTNWLWGAVGDTGHVDGRFNHFKAPFRDHHLLPQQVYWPVSGVLEVKWLCV